MKNMLCEAVEKSLRRPVQTNQGPQPLLLENGTFRLTSGSIEFDVFSCTAGSAGTRFGFRRKGAGRGNGAG